MLKINLIVTTYNRPDALKQVLYALAAQNMLTFEVIIADDGSNHDTAELIKQLQLPYPLQHIWQEDKGFRAAKIRNKAVAAAQGNYLIFLDGDCIPQMDFVAKHAQLAEDGCFVAGNRILLSKEFTLKSQNKIWKWKTVQWLIAYLHNDINRLLPLLRLPDSFLRKYKQKWQGAKTCNLAIWREDFIKINGFNENFQGWGHEDAELVVRLLRSNTQRKEGRFAVPVFHLWHPEQDRSQEKENRQQLEQILNSTTIVAKKGIYELPAK